MTKIIKSRYSIFRNFEEDTTGCFLFKMKRREITRGLLFFSRILNKIEPLRLSDLLINRKKKIRSLRSLDNFRFRKIRFFYNFGSGKTKFFIKSQYRFLHKKIKNRLLTSVLSLESRLDILLVKLRLFNFVFDSRLFVKNKGVLINGKLIKNCNYRLVRGDILSFTNENKIIFKRKIYRLLRARPSNTPLKNLANLELNSTLTAYTWLFKRYTGVSPLLLLGFPRYIEPNFNSMEFYFYGIINVEDVYYPFRTSLSERNCFFNNYI